MYYEFPLNTPLPVAGYPPNVSGIKFKSEVETALGIVLPIVMYREHKFLVPEASISLDTEQSANIQAIADTHTYDPSTEGYDMGQKTAALYNALY